MNQTTRIVLLFSLLSSVAPAKVEEVKQVKDWLVYCDTEKKDPVDCVAFQAVKNSKGGQIARLGFTVQPDGNLKLYVETTVPYMREDERVERPGVTRYPPAGVHSVPLTANGEQLFNILFHPADCKSDFCSVDLPLENKDARKILESEELGVDIEASEAGGVMMLFNSGGLREALAVFAPGALPPETDYEVKLTAEQEAQRESEATQLGMRRLSTSEAFSTFAWRDDGQFLISKARFETHQAAAKFCADQVGYELTPEILPTMLWWVGGGFKELNKDFLTNNLIYSSLGAHDEHGVMFWYNVKAPKANSLEESQLSEDSKKRLSAIRADAYVGFDWMYTSEVLGGAFPLADINQIRANHGLSKLALPAICVDQKMRMKLEKPQ